MEPAPAKLCPGCVDLDGTLVPTGRPERGLMLLQAAGGYNSLYLQAKLLARVLGQGSERAWEVAGTGGWRALARLWRRLRGGDPIVYHFGGFDPLASLLAWRRRTVFVYHNITPFAELGRYQPLVALWALLGRLQLRLAPRRLRWVAVSPYNARGLSEQGFENVEYCPCLVEPRPARRKAPEPALLFVGRISPSKNCLELVEQAEAAARLTGLRLTLHVVGEGKRHCRYHRRFRREIEQCGRRGRLRVAVHERLPLAELDALYGAAWLYVSLSRHEGFGLPVVEAILGGAPAMYRACGGTEAVLEGCGLLAAGRPAAEGIAELLTNERRCRELWERQRELAGQFTPEQLRGRILDVYGRSLAA